MQELLNELTNPRMVSPTAAMLRAAKLIKELAAMHQSDLQGRLRAEALAVEQGTEIDRLRRLLNEKTNSNIPIDTTTGEQTGNPVAKPHGDEVPN